MKSIFILFSLLLTTLANAEIREIKQMSQILPEIMAKTLVVFDLDNTVIEAKQTMGSDQFFGYLVEKAKAQGLDEKSAVDCALKNAGYIQPVTASKAVEEYTPKLIYNLQNKGYPVLALTARPFQWARGTLSQLNSVHVDFRRTALRSSAIQDPNFTARYLNGVLFMKNGQDKGVALRNFIAGTGRTFDRVIFVDDKLRNVQNVDAAFANSSIYEISYRYGAADPKVKGFNRQIAEIEWSYFAKYHVIISDVNAWNILKQNGPVASSTLVCQ